MREMVEIKIGRKYVQAFRKMTGSQLRELGGVHERHDLFQVRPLEGDVLIGDMDVVRCVRGTTFFYTPKHINAGLSR